MVTHPLQSNVYSSCEKGNLEFGGEGSSTLFLPPLVILLALIIYYVKMDLYCLCLKTGLVRESNICFFV